MKTVRRTISGARVNFDPRSTAEVEASRDMKKHIKPKNNKKKEPDGPANRR